MTWEKVKLGDIAEFSNGINFDKSSYGKGIKLITVSNFGNLRFPPYNELVEIKEEAVKKNDYLCDGDIIFVRSNGNKELVGRCLLINKPFDKVTYSGFCIRARLLDKNKYNPLYFTYHFKNIEFRRAMSGTAVGANIQNLSQGRLSAYELKIPPIATQTKIANILSAYDDLIENNQNQIKLLEEAAQRLYKEWFVDFRFPGHENTEFVDGLPSGWIQGNLGEIAEFKRGKTITKAQVHDGKVPVVAGGLEPAYYHNKANTIAPVITVSGSGANAGFSRLYNIDVFASDCSFADSETTPYLFFVYAFLKENKALLDTLQKGSAQPHVYAKDINTLKLYIPPEDRLKEYCNIVSFYYGKIKRLEEQKNILTEARDRLLPKLMSGEISLSSFLKGNGCDSNQGDF